MMAMTLEPLKAAACSGVKTWPGFSRQMSSPPCLRGLRSEASDRKPRKHGGLLICLEKPGQVFTPEQAAALSGSKVMAIMQSLTPSAIKRGGYACNGFHFRWADAPSDSNGQSAIGGWQS